MKNQKTKFEGFCVGYCRISKKEKKRLAYSGDMSRSIKYQKSILLTEAEKRKLKLIRFYIDDGVSGDTKPTSKRRRDFWEMRQTFKNKIKPIWKTILVTEISRYSRSYQEAYRDELINNGVVLISCLSNENQEFGRIMSDMKNKMELYATSDRVKLRHLDRIDKGLNTTRLPFGYIKIKKGRREYISLEPKNSRIVKVIFELKAKSYLDAHVQDYIQEHLQEDIGLMKIKIVKENSSYIGLMHRTISEPTKQEIIFYKPKSFPLLTGKCVTDPEKDFDIFTFYKLVNPEVYQELEKLFKCDLRKIKEGTKVTKRII